MEDFSKQQIKSLLDDELFIQWVLHPTAETNELWEERMRANEEQRNNIEGLKKIIESLRVKEPEISEKEKRIIWSKIEKEIDIKQQKKYRPAILWAASVAASIIIILGIYVFLLAGQGNTMEIDYSLYSENTEDEMKTGVINLVLSDNKRIDIDKDSTVIAYDAEGAVNIGSQKVEEKASAEKATTPELNQLIVPYGKTTSLILSDGTKIWVNSGSKLIYPAVFDKNKREIFLSGEVFLDVARNEKAPFIVKTNSVELNVLGTSFNVSAYNDDDTQSVVLVSGSVEVKSKDLQGTYKIEPNQMFSYNKDSNKIHIEKVDVDQYVSWIYGYLITQNENLDSVFQKLSRHFNIAFVYDRTNFRKTTFSGKLDLKLPISNILENISIANGNKLKYDIKDDSIQLLLI
ncbi:FecR family protein [Bacteroides sp. 519]|uniref:FecR family protein n=1 Tax=Bacteroides sp. 519 TaxID=2302937 RepID=UPI0013D2EFDF|nr:FecR family protein [Bacteroides sp. 519]